MFFGLKKKAEPGVIHRYDVLYVSGFDGNEGRMSTVEWRLMDDRFTFQAGKRCKGFTNFELPYNRVFSLSLPAPKPLSFQGLAKDYDSSAVDKDNQFYIGYLDESGQERTLEFEMLSGFEGPGQVMECKNMLVVLEQEGIREKFLQR